jgi:two-component system, chemotaxis family, protein-glutamate methylesterase/glutaminase
MRTIGSMVAVAASAGGLDALARVLSALRADYRAPIAVVQHRGARVTDSLAKLLRNKTSLQVRTAVDGEVVEARDGVYPPSRAPRAEQVRR